MKNLKISLNMDAFLKDKNEVIGYIQNKNFDEANSKIESCIEECALEIKRHAIDDEILANTFYIIRSYWTLLKNYIKFCNLASTSPDGAWNFLQDCFISIDVLDMAINGNEYFDTEKLNTFFEKIEALYPYKLFWSLGYVAKEAVCSICGKNSFDPSCIHIGRELYQGKRHYVKIENIEDALEISIVKNPANKKSIIIINYDKKEVKYGRFGQVWQLAKISPFYDFEIISEKRKITVSEYMKYLKNIERNPLRPDGRFVFITHKTVAQKSSLF